MTEPICYVCLTEESNSEKFMDPSPCACQGTINIHQSCFGNLVSQNKDNHPKCLICNSQYVYTTIYKKYYYKDRVCSEGPRPQPIVGVSDSERGSAPRGPLVNGLQHGYWKFYDISCEGQLIVQEGNKIAGNKDGLWKSYYLDGSLCEEEYYVNGKLHGINKRYYRSGALYIEEPNFEGEIHGLRKVYWDSGTIKLEEEYVHGLRHGFLRKYLESGTLKEERIYENDSIVK